MATFYSRILRVGRTVVAGSAMLLVSAFPVLGPTQMAIAAAPPVWSAVGTYDITFRCVTGCAGDYTHRANVTTQNNATGDFSGTGYYITDPSYTWNITGNTVDSNYTFHLLYTGTLAGYTVDGVGTIDENGNISGTATDSLARTFTWWNASGNLVEAVGNGVQPTECTGTYTNVIHGTNNGETLKGTAQADLIFGYGGNDTIRGLAGDDCLVGGLGDDVLDGGSADDVVLGKVGNDTVKGGAGDDVVLGGSGNDTLRGDAGMDSLTGEAGTDSANGGTGTDTCSAETTTRCE